MAQNTTVVYVDDLDGKPITDNASPTVTFALDGTTYEVDLHDQNQEKLRTALEPYVAVARKVGRKSGTAGKRTQGAASAAEIRAWAQSNGHDVPNRGRIPASVREAFEAR